MPSDIIIDVKLNKPFLKEFIISMYKSDPVIASTKNAIGIFIKQLLEKPPKELKHIKNDESNTIKIILPNYNDKRINSCNYISEHNQNLFSSFIFSLFRDMFFTYINERLKLGFQKKDSILQFCYDNNISFDKTNYETLKKLYDRYNKREKINNKIVNKMSRQLSEEFTAKIICSNSKKKVISNQ
jgi:hypothetical protein